ncbi:MAG TPA: pitrilysin family protein, partial [Gemmatimonadales bacterium]|nr:pitrilysin family protein [Gemmatimonadales bacterium]
ACTAPSALTAQSTGRIAYSTYTLSNGLRVVFSRDHSTPIVTVNVWYHVGSANERPRRSGFAHLFEHMMFQGSANVRKAEHFQLIERAGGQMNGSTTEDRTNYYETLPSNRLNLALWLEADRMRSLAVTDSNFENQRQAVKEERRLRIDNQPYVRYVIEGFTLPFDSTTCFAYAHTVIGDMADLDSARLEDVQAFFDAYYRPSNAVLTVVGDFDEAEARRLIEQYFGDIPPGTRAADPPCDHTPGRGERRLTVTDPNANLPAVVMVYTAPPRNHADAPALELLTTILGQGESSRLNRRLVRQDQAALGAGAIAQFRRGSSVSLFFGITNQGVSAERLESLLNDELARLATDSGRITEDELVKAQNQYRVNTIRSRQTTMGVAEALQSALRFHGDLEAVNTELQRYLAVTLADLQRVAREYLRPANRLTLVINPPAGRDE